MPAVGLPCRIDRLTVRLLACSLRQAPDDAGDSAGKSESLRSTRASRLQRLPREPGPGLPVLDLYVATSLKEGHPLSLLEAMGAGRGRGHRDVMVHGETGLLVPPENPTALADAILSLLADRERRRRMGEAGRRRALNQFGIQPMVEKTAKVYRCAAATLNGNRAGASWQPWGARRDGMPG